MFEYKSKYTIVYTSTAQIISWTINKLTDRKWVGNYSSQLVSDLNHWNKHCEEFFLLSLSSGSSVRILGNVSTNNCWIHEENNEQNENNDWCRSNTKQDTMSSTSATAVKTCFYINEDHLRTSEWRVQQSAETLHCITVNTSSTFSWLYLYTMDNKCRY